MGLLPGTDKEQLLFRISAAFFRPGAAVAKSYRDSGLISADSAFQFPGRHGRGSRSRALALLLRKGRRLHKPQKSKIPVFIRLGLAKRCWLADFPPSGEFQAAAVS
jgi:hypothetical protein